MKRLGIIMALLMFMPHLFSQQDLVIEGNYWGNNIYVFNPSVNGEFSIRRISVNNVVLDSVFNSNSYVVELTGMNLSIGQPLLISIQHLPEAEPFVTNIEAIAPNKECNIESFKHNKKENNLNWSPKELCKGKIYEIEQFIWGKWHKVSDIGLADTVSATSFTPLYHSGLNLFRIKQSERNTKNVSFTKSIKVRPATHEAFIVNIKTAKILEFTEPTMFEIIDIQGKMIKSGKGQEVNIESLPKGEYFVNFDNKTEGFIKK